MGAAASWDRSVGIDRVAHCGGRHAGAPVRFWLRSFLLLAVLIYPTDAPAQLSINTTSAPPLAEDDDTGFHDLLTIEAFKRIGLRVDLYRLPGERALVNLQKGIDDGTVVRIAGLEQLYPDIRRVPEPLMHWEFVAFTRTVDVALPDWRSLAPFHIAFINGWKILEANARHARSVTTVRDAEQLFGLLLNDRADVVLYEKWQGLHLLQKLGRDDVRLLTPPLAAPEMYMYLHKRHAALLPKLAAALKEIKTDGTYTRIFEQTLQPLAAVKN